MVKVVNPIRPGKKAPKFSMYFNLQFPLVATRPIHYLIQLIPFRESASDPKAFGMNLSQSKIEMSRIKGSDEKGVIVGVDIQSR